MGNVAVDHEHLDMDAINHELSCVHGVTGIPALYIDDCEGFFPFEINPRNLTEQVLLHLSFLREELRSNLDMVYVEDLTEHVKDNYGKLIPNIRKLLSKEERVGFSRKRQAFVGRIHPAWHALCKSGVSMDHDNTTNTIKLTVDRRWFYVGLDG